MCKWISKKRKKESEVGEKEGEKVRMGEEGVGLLDVWQGRGADGKVCG